MSGRRKKATSWAAEELLSTQSGRLIYLKQYAQLQTVERVDNDLLGVCSLICFTRHYNIA